MTEFEMLSGQKIEFNNGGEFLELSFNVARDGKRETRYLRLARGYYGSDGEPRYKKGGVTLPGDNETLAALGEALKNLDLAPLKAGQAEGAQGAGEG